jgi:tellurite resistance protein TerC
MDWTLIVIVLQLIFLEGVLSIDNAAVLGAMVSHLPDDIPIDWPPALRPLGQALHWLVGNQRTAALRVGLLGAYIGRGTMLVLADLIIHSPWLRIVGALYLLKLAFDNLGRAEPGETDAHVHPLEQKSFWSIVLAVELADLAFSLDNVVAAVAVSDKLLIVMFGVAIGILLMRFAAGWFSYWVEREPVLKTAAYVLVLNIAIELLLQDLAGVPIGDWLRFGISLATLALALIYAHVKWLHVIDPALVWLAQGFANFNEVFDWALRPILALIKLPFRLIKAHRPTDPSTLTIQSDAPHATSRPD